MFHMTGRYNTASIMIDEIDETTRAQIQTFLDHPAFADTRIAIMPDCHAGKGAVIGLTMTLNDYVIPNVIGVDIGCGMLSARFPPGGLQPEALDGFIKLHIPYGFSINRDMVHAVDKVLIRDVRKACGMIGIDPEKALRAVGSLGGGNHFIEAGRDSRGGLYITVHSGSRNFGKCVAEYYQKKAREMALPSAAKGRRKGAGTRDLEFLPASSREAGDYFFCLDAAQRFAHHNRLEMLHRIERFLGREPEELVESVHNYIDPEDRTVRKGATSAKRGEKVLIPFNMRDGIALCTGKGNPRYNLSAPHGAGRVLSRSAAKKTLSLAAFKKEMQGIYTTTAVAGTLDEAPAAYKDKDLILANIAETVDVLDFIKPVYNFKAAGD
jgi:RNA-splicing ligase RtcB